MRTASKWNRVDNLMMRLSWSQSWGSCALLDGQCTLYNVHCALLENNLFQPFKCLLGLFGFQTSPQPHFKSMWVCDRIWIAHRFVSSFQFTWLVQRCNCLVLQHPLCIMCHGDGDGDDDGDGDRWETIIIGQVCGGGIDVQGKDEWSNLFFPRLKGSQTWYLANSLHQHIFTILKSQKLANHQHFGP